MRWRSVWCGISNAGIVVDLCGSRKIKGAELEGKTFDLPVDLCFNPHFGHELRVVSESTR